MNLSTLRSLAVQQGARTPWYSLGWISVVLLALMIYTGVLMSTHYLPSSAPAQASDGTPMGVAIVRHGHAPLHWLGRTYAPGELIALPLDPLGDSLLSVPSLRDAVAPLRAPGSGHLLRPAGAWVSVEQTIARDADLGWLVRAVHRITSRLLIASLFLHLCASLAMGAYDRKRRWTWSGGIGLLILALASAFTGYVLPWNQLSLVAARIAAGIAAQGIPLFGSDAAELLRGGRDVGAATLGRFASLHTTVLPLLLVGLVTWHVAQLRRHGLASGPARTAEGLRGNPMALIAGVALVALIALVVLPLVPGRFSAEGPLFLIGILILSSSIAAMIGLGGASSTTERPLGRHIYQDLLAALLVVGALLTIALIAPRVPVTAASLPVDLTAPLTTPAHVRPEWYFAFLYELVSLLPERLAMAVLFVGLVVLGGLPWHERLHVSARTAGAVGGAVIVALIVLTFLGMR